MQAKRREHARLRLVCCRAVQTRGRARLSFARAADMVVRNAVYLCIAWNGRRYGLTSLYQGKVTFILLFILLGVDCGAPGTPADGSLTLPSRSTLPGSTAQWSCNLGFTAPGATMYALCREDGTWSRRPPVCARKYASENSRS